MASDIGGQSTSDNSISDSTESWTIISSRLDENQKSSQSTTQSSTDNEDCLECRNSSEVNESHYGNSKDILSPTGCNSDLENLNSDIDDSSLSDFKSDTSSDSLNSSSLDSYEMYRDSSPSVPSETSESSFSVIDQPGAVRPLTPDILEGINEDLVDLSAVSSLQDGLTSDIDLEPAERHYVHIPNSHLNYWLNIVALLWVAAVFGLGIGNFIGMSKQWWLERQIAKIQVLKLKQLQDDLVLCMKEKLELENNFKNDISNLNIEPSFNKVNQMFNLDMFTTVQLNQETKLMSPGEQIDVFHIQEMKIHHLQKENKELRETLQCLTDQIETNWNSNFIFGKTKEQNVEEQSELSITERVRKVKDHINQMVSENEELKSTVGRLRYSNPTIEPNVTVETDKSQNGTIDNIYKYWKDKTLLMIRNNLPSYNSNWVDTIWKKHPDTETFNVAVNNMLSSLSEKFGFLKDGLYSTFNVQAMKLNINNKLAELEKFGQSDTCTKYTNCINKTVKKMKDIIQGSIQKLHETIEKFKNKQINEIKTKKLDSKLSKIISKLDHKWLEIKDKWLRFGSKKEKTEHKCKEKQATYNKYREEEIDKVDLSHSLVNRKKYKPKKYTKNQIETSLQNQRIVY